MSAREVEALAVELREREIARQLAYDPEGIASSDTPRTIAGDVLDSDWLRAREAAAAEQARAEVAAAAGDDSALYHRIEKRITEGPAVGRADDVQDIFVNWLRDALGPERDQ